MANGIKALQLAMAHQTTISLHSARKSALIHLDNGRLVLLGQSVAAPPLTECSSGTPLGNQTKTSRSRSDALGYIPRAVALELVLTPILLWTI